MVDRTQAVEGAEGIGDLLVKIRGRHYLIPAEAIGSPLEDGGTEILGLLEQELAAVGTAHDSRMIGVDFAMELGVSDDRNARAITDDRNARAVTDDRNARAITARQGRSCAKEARSLTRQARSLERQARSLDRQSRSLGSDRSARAIRP